MTTKGSFYKQIIILMGTNNAERVMAQANNHVENINRLLRGIKSEIFADYCYGLKSLELDKRTNSCIRVNTRELDKEPFTK